MSVPAAGAIRRMLPAARFDRSARELAWPAGVVVAGIAAAFMLTRSPFVTVALVGGAATLVVVLVRPLMLLGVMLVLGPIDLSFLTGGFKNLLTEQGGLDMNGIRLLGLTFGLSAIMLVDREVVRHLFERYGRWYVLFLAYGACTLLYSMEVVTGLRLLVKIAYPLLVFIAVLGLARSGEDLDRLLDWTLVGAAITTVLLNPLYVMAGGYEVDLQGRIRTWGVGTHQNPFSFYLLMMIIFSLARFIVRGHGRYLALGAVLGVWMVLTLTRITFGASVIALLGLGVYGALRDRNYRLLTGAAAATLVLGFALVPVVLERTLGFVPGPTELFSLLQDPVALYEAMNWQGREILWPFILAAFVQSPLLGLGLGTTVPLLQSQFPTEWGLVVHNEYLRLTAETGLVGAALFLTAMTQWFRGILHAASVRAPRVREFAYPALAGMIAWAVIAITDNPFDYYASFTQYIAFAFAGALAASRFARDEAALSPASDGTPR